MNTFMTVCFKDDDEFLSRRSGVHNGTEMIQQQKQTIHLDAICTYNINTHCHRRHTFVLLHVSVCLQNIL